MLSESDCTFIDYDKTAILDPFNPWTVGSSKVIQGRWKAAPETPMKAAPILPWRYLPLED